MAAQIGALVRDFQRFHESSQQLYNRALVLINGGEALRWGALG